MWNVCDASNENNNFVLFVKMSTHLQVKYASKTKNHELNAVKIVTEFL